MLRPSVCRQAIWRGDSGIVWNPLYRQLCPSGNIELTCHSEEQGDEESRGSCKNPLEILRGVYPEPAEGLRMTIGRFRMDIN
jgi:hypothetical protein